MHAYIWITDTSVTVRMPQTNRKSNGPLLQAVTQEDGRYTPGTGRWTFTASQSQRLQDLLVVLGYTVNRTCSHDGRVKCRACELEAASRRQDECAHDGEWTWDRYPNHQERVCCLCGLSVSREQYREMMA